MQKRHLEDFLIPFGYGDGGGGPCRDHIEYALRERDLEGMPKVEMCSPLEFFEALQAKGGPQNHLGWRAVLQRSPRYIHHTGFCEKKQSPQ